MSNIFKVGEKVVATKTERGADLSLQRVQDRLYTVTAVQYCLCCGQQMINVDNAGDDAPFVMCYCYAKTPGRGLGWGSSRTFTRPISHEYKLEVAIPELLEIKTPQLQ